MAEAAVWFFYVHTAMCGIFVVMVASFALKRWRERHRTGELGLSAAGGRGRELGLRGPADEAFLHGMGYVTLGLYLLYAEVYLFRVYSYLQP